MNERDDRGGPDSGAGREPAQGLRQVRLARLSWLPIPLLTAAIIVARAAGSSESYMSEPLRLVLSFTFYTMVSLGTLFLIGRSFLASGAPGLLLLECGVVLWSLAGTVGDAAAHGDQNINVTIFNTTIFLAGLCHLAGAILSRRPQSAFRAPPLWLGGACAAALGAVWLVTHAALAGRLPVFFIPGQGGTPARYCVLVSAIAAFVLSAGFLLAGRREARTPFTTWYASALLLLAVGLFGVMIQLSLGSVVNWLGRTAQWLGGVYLLLAAVAALRESDLPLFAPEEKSRPERYPYAVAMAIVAAATAVRFALSPALGITSPFLTFYPAVILATLYGGLRAGLLTTVLSALVVDYFWLEPVGRFAIGSPTDWVTMLFFLLSCAMVSLAIEAMHRARARASAAETQAVLAAERGAASEALGKSEARYHTLFTGMTEGFAVHELLVDASGKPVDYRFLDVNPAFERLTGLKRQDVVGRTYNEVLPGDDPTWLRMYGQVALTGQPVQFENYAPALKRHYEVFAYRTAPMQFAVIFLDVTKRTQTAERMREARAAAINLMEDAVEARERTEQANEKLRHEIAERERAEEALRESEQRHRLLAETMLQGVVHQDAGGEVVEMNPAAERILGKTREQFLGSSSMGEERHTIRENGETFPGMDHPAMVALRTGKEARGVVMGVFNPKVAEYRWISIDAVPVFRPGQTTPSEVYTVFEDITERKQMEDELRASRDGLELRVYERTEAIEEAYRNLKEEIAERERAEKTRDESERRYITLFNAIDQGFCIVQMIFDENEKPIDYRFLEVNAAFGKQTGLIDAQGKRMRALAPRRALV